MEIDQDYSNKYSAGKNYKADRKNYYSQKVMEIFLMQVLFSFA